MRKLNALIAGSTGYIGVQLIKLLVKHKHVSIKYLCGNNSAGKDISSLGIEPTFFKVLTGGKYPKNIKDSSLFEFDI